MRTLSRISFQYMSISNLSGSNSAPEFRPITPAMASAAAAVLGVGAKRLKVEKTKIHKIAKKFAEIAMSAGLTNNEEEFAEEMTNTIFNAYKDVEEKYAKENTG